MKYQFAQIKNIQPKTGLNLGAAQFFFAIFCEYLVSYCGYGADDNDFYSLLKRKFTSSESIESVLLSKITRINEMQELYKLFPVFNVGGSFDNAALESFLVNSSIEILEEDNAFDFQGHKFRWKRQFVNVIEKEGVPLACTYACRLNKAIWQRCGITATMAEAPLVVFDTMDKPEKLDDDDMRTITEKEFFDSAESPRDLRELDPEQKFAVSAPIEKNVLILAGAGSGKTRCLVSRLAYLHLVKGVPLDKIVLLTFTKNVASEMRERATNLMIPVYAQYYPNAEPKLDVRTIDSFFLKVIRNFYDEVGFQNDSEPIFYFSTDKEDKATIDKKLSVMREAVYENGLESVFGYYYVDPKDENDAYAKQKQLLRKLENYMIGLPVNQSGITILLNLYLDWQLWHNEVLGFECAQTLIARALEDPTKKLKERLSSQYRCILIDEFQDISILQNKIFSFFYDGSIHFTFCGDDDQTIYGFRGSDNSIIQGISKMKNVVNAPLITNYRSDPCIVDAANSILERIEGRAKTIKMKTALKTKSKIHHATYSRDYSELISEVSQIIDSGAKPSEILILYRSNAVVELPNGRRESEAEYLYSTLTGANIEVKRPDPAYELGQNYDLFSSIFSIILGFNMIESVAKIRDYLGVSGSKYADIYIKNVVMGKDEPDEYFVAVSCLAEVVRTSEDKSLADVIDRYALKAGELFERSSNSKHSDPIYEELRYLAVNQNMEWRTPPIRFKNFLKTFEGRYRKAKSTKKSSENGVRINTIHKAKGLQAKYVFIIDLEAGKVPNTSQIDLEYERSKGELNSIRASKRLFADLKKTINETVIHSAMAELKSAGEDAREKELLSDLLDVFDADFQERLKALESFAVEQFNYSYRASIIYLDGRYERKFNELEVKGASLRERLEKLIDQRKECQNQNVEFPKEMESQIADAEKLIRENEELKQRFKIRRDLFKKSTPTIRNISKICTRAASYLLDMGREEELEGLEKELIARKKKAVNEERRVFYVAVTRAESALYLMHAEGTKPSEFITMIPKDYIQDEKLLSKSQREDLGVQIKEVNDAIAKSESENISRKDLVVSIKDEDVHKYVDSFIQGFLKEHHYCSGLDAEARAWLETALTHDCISKMTGIPNELAIATCLEHSIIALYKERIGPGIQPIRIGNGQMLEEAVTFLKREMERCQTNAIGKNTIRHIFNPVGPQSDSGTALKSLSTTAYYVNCNPYGRYEREKNNWGKICKNRKKESYKNVFVNSIDLMNYRNYVVHEDQTAWPANLLINLFKTYLVIVKNAVEEH